MAKCTFRKVCAFFQNDMEYMPGTAGLYRQKFCLGKPSGCARFALFRALGPDAMPDDLFPYDHARLDALLADKQTA